MAKQFLNFGSLVATSAVNQTMATSEKFKDEVQTAFKRYSDKDWGDLPQSDKNMNDKALEGKSRIVAKYNTSEGAIYIITEWDRSLTTILFIDEY